MPGGELGFPGNVLTTPLDSEGRFEIAGVPKERISFSLSMRGYRFSPKNPNVRPDMRGLSGRLTRDLENFVVLLEPGRPLNWGEYDQPSFEEEQQRQDREMKGVEQGGAVQTSDSREP